jgi:hypothetical protein
MVLQETPGPHPGPTFVSLLMPGLRSFVADPGLCTNAPPGHTIA